jgi:hypothetical protein
MIPARECAYVLLGIVSDSVARSVVFLIYCFSDVCQLRCRGAASIRRNSDERKEMDSGERVWETAVINAIGPVVSVLLQLRLLLGS